uniref:Putative aminotransferase n=1 Tax=viral metagenome TaxID=1070528 RepID=A0A6M3IID7_9ZZZZ
MKYTKVVTKLPHPEDIKLLREINKYEANSMQGQIPVIWKRAKDFLVEDRHGNRFIDFTSGICVTNSGHGNIDIIKAIRKQIDIPLTYSYTFGTEIRYEFLKELVNTCYPKGKAFLVSSGTEATEVAIKLMRMYGLKQNPRKKVILSFEGAMHGRTMTAEKLKGEIKDNQWAEPWDCTFIKLPYPTSNSNFEVDLYKYYSKSLYDICGIIIESYQGWSASFLPINYVKQIIKKAKEYKWLVCFDEIQSGIGRTGKMWAWEHYNIKRPDLICFGKGISSSVPLSGVIGRKDILDTPDIGSMSSTHSANPICCATGLANLKYIKKHNLIEKAKNSGKIIIKALFELNLKGNGLAWAIHTDTVEEADKIVDECFKKGLLVVKTHKKSVKIVPPLTINEQALKEGLEILVQVIGEIK